MVSIKDVAKRAGVSATTVSFVLNGKGNISQETRDRVMQAVSELNYTRNVLGRSLRSQRSHIIGYARGSQSKGSNPVMDRFLSNIAKAAEELGRHILLFHVDHSDVVTPYQDLIQSGRVDGFILSYTEHNDPRFDYLHNAGVPFVAFGRSDTEMDEFTNWVDVDGAAGTYAAVQHLVEQGHQHVGFVGWPVGSTSGDNRYTGFQRAMAENNLPVRGNWVLRTENAIESGRDVARHFLQMQTRPTAVIAVSDYIAIGLLQVFVQAGVRIAVIGFDNTPWAEFITPTLTSVDQPIIQVVDLLIAMLANQLESEDAVPEHHILTPELIIRESSQIGRP